MMKLILCLTFALLIVPGGSCDADSFTFSTIDYPGAVYTFAEGINDSGQVVGEYGFYHGFLKTDASFTSIDYPSANGRSWVRDINNSGQIVGYYGSGNAAGGFVTDGTNFVPVDYPGSFYTRVSGINNGGQIVGDYSPFSEQQVNPTEPQVFGFIKDGTNFSRFEYPGSFYTTATAINDNGQVVGNYGPYNYGHGFLKDGTTFTPINYPGALDTYVTGINDYGEIVGYYHSLSGDEHGFLECGGNYISIDDPDAKEFTLALGINNNGQIVGYFDTRGFIATPIVVPEPSVIALLAVGVLLLFGLTKYRHSKLQRHFLMRNTAKAGSCAVRPNFRCDRIWRRLLESICTSR